jgi:hypothetical protein
MTLTMYPGMVNSPELTLTSLISAVTTTIEVTGDVATKLPAAPNLFVIGTGEDCETILYPTDAVLNVFSGVTREFQGTAKEWALGTVVSRNFTAYDYDALRQNIDELHYQKTVTISPVGGDYHTIQAALDANPTTYTLFQVYPGVYADDTVYFTANDQSVIGLDNSTTQILGSTTTNVVNFGAFTGCALNRVTVTISGATSGVATVTGSTGNIIINDCTLEMTNGTHTGATQPSVINITSTGTCEVYFGYINYTNTVAAAAIKAAILLGTGAYVRLRRAEVTIAGAGASTGITLSYGTSTGRITATRTNISITDTATTATVGLYQAGSSTTDEITNCYLHVVGGAAVGIWNTTASATRSFGNHIHVTGTTAYSFRADTGATITSVYDDIIAAQGVYTAGTGTVSILPATRAITLSAYSAIQSSTNSAVLGQTDMGTNAFPLPYGIFQAGASRTVERLCWMTPIENNWDGGTVTAQIEWTTETNVTTTCAWSLRAVRIPDNAALTTAIPEVVAITDAAAGAYYKRLSAVSANFAITGTGNTILWELRRGTTSDTLVESALFLALKILYKVA